MALREGHEKTALYLIDHGGITSQNRAWVNSLIEAIKSGLPKAVEAILRKESSAGFVDNDGVTALLHALKASNKEIALHFRYRVASFKYK